MRVFRLSLSLAALLFASPAMVPAQEIAAAKPSPATGTAPYAGESYVINRMDQVYSENGDGTGWRQRTVAIKVQSDAAVRQLGVVAIPFASASEHVEFTYVRARKPDGSVVETALTGAIEQPEKATVEAPFYSDLKEEQLPVKSLQVGDTLEWQAKVVRTKAEAPGQFWGQESFLTEDAVVLEESIELRVPAAETVNVWTNPKLDVKPKETVSGEQRVIRWEDAALKPTVGKEADAAKVLKKKTILTPDEEVDAEQGKLPSVAWTTFKSWEAVGAWYRGLEGDRFTPDEAVKAKVAELIAGKTTEEDKVRAVYSYVSSQIRYIGVAFGVGRYQPHRAGDVLDNQYGDCKDKHTLLAAMLTALGLDPDAVLIGAGVRFNEAVPSPSAFNHLITRVKVGGQEVWLDSTEEIAPYRMMYAVLRDKPALVVPDKGTAMIEHTPADPPFASFQNWVAKGVLDDKGVSESHISLETRGDEELALRAAVRQVAPAQYEEFMQQLAHSIGYAGTTSHTEIGQPEDTTAPFAITFDYHREQAGDWDNLRIIPQLPPTGLQTVDEKEPPVQAIDLGWPRTETSSAQMKLPAGWGVELPEAIHEKTAFATYDLTYKFVDGTLDTEMRLVVLQRKVPAADWKAYKKWQDAVGEGNWGYVQLTKGSLASAAGSGKKNDAKQQTAKEAESSAKAEELIQKAMSALTNDKNTDKAKSLLDEAKKLNPQQRLLWAGYAAVAYDLGITSEEVSDAKKELSLHPDSYQMYAVIVDGQMKHGDNAGAEATLQIWITADPSDPIPVAQLLRMLLAGNKTAEAIKATDAALANLSPDKLSNPALQLEIGEAQLRGGKDDSGAVTLETLLKTSDDLSVMNSAAYELANAKKDLPLADATERAVLDKLTAETQSWTMDEAPLTLRQKSSLLIASWDTMGWILFQEGKAKEGKPYVEAAWRNQPGDEVGGHLSKIKAALGITGAAAAEKSEQERRTIQLGPSGGRDGVTEYRLMISRNGVDRVVPVGEAKITNGTDLIEKLNLLGYVPQDSQAKLVRWAMLNCFSGKCELVFMP